MKKGKLKRQKPQIEVPEKVKEKMENPSLKLMIYGEAPFIRTSEGVLSNYLGSKLIELGIPTVVTASYGIEPYGMLRYGDLLVLPLVRSDKDPHGFFTASLHFIKFRLDAILFLHDFWEIESVTQFPVIMVARIDSIEYPQEKIEKLRECKYVVAPTLFAEKELKKYGIECTYLPIGVNTESFKPYPKDLSKKIFNIKPEEFSIGVVASNTDKDPKKGWDSIFETISIFFNKHPEVRDKVRILIHSLKETKEGLNLEELAKQFGINDRIVWQDQHLMLIGMPEGTMARMYSAMDVLLNLSRREGTCFPVLEAGACGVPSIVTDFAVMSERVNFGKCGWLVPVKDYVQSYIGSKIAIPDVEKAAEKLWEAYSNKGKRENLGKKARMYAQQFSWDMIIKEKWYPYILNITKEILNSKGVVNADQNKD